MSIHRTIIHHDILDYIILHTIPTYNVLKKRFNNINIKKRELSVNFRRGGGGF